jgi:hypothetical protein
MLEDHIPAEMIGLIPEISEKEWNSRRKSSFFNLLTRFLTFRNLLAYRGHYTRDVLGYGWGALYQTLRASSVVATTYRNGGHLRAGERLFGTGEFSQIFKMPRNSKFLHDVIRVVNLRHHVAGVVLPSGVLNLVEGHSGAEVVPGYEADFAYISASYVENIMRGYRACGVRPGSRTWQRLGENLTVILYQSAKATGLSRAPKDFHAQEEFCRAYEERFKSHPPGERITAMARETALRMVPVTAAMTGISMEEHIDRHIDELSRQWLFPDRSVLKEMQPVYAEWMELRQEKAKAAKKAARQRLREELMERPDVAALWEAYGKIPRTHTDSRLMGAVLLHAIDDPESSYKIETIQITPEKPLLRQGEVSEAMVVILESSEPLLITCSAEPESESCQAEEEVKVVEEISGPAILGDLGLLGNRRELTTTGVRRPATLRVIRIDRNQFAALSTQSGFRSAVAADVQYALRTEVKGLLHLLVNHPEMESDEGYCSLVLLLQHLCGEEGVPLDRIKAYPQQATVQESIEFLRPLAADVKHRLGDRHHLTKLISAVAETIGC